MGAPNGNGRLRWQWFLEWVVIPGFGTVVAFVAIVGVQIPGWLIPMIPGAIIFPFARQVDKLRREK